jgi:hypothetical protein
MDVAWAVAVRRAFSWTSVVRPSGQTSVRHATTSVSTADDEKRSVARKGPAMRSGAASALDV